MKLKRRVLDSDRIPGAPTALQRSISEDPSSLTPVPSFIAGRHQPSEFDALVQHSPAQITMRSISSSEIVSAVRS